jgi:hypothetical protein
LEAVVDTTVEDIAEGIEVCTAKCIEVCTVADTTETIVVTTSRAIVVTIVATIAITIRGSLVYVHPRKGMSIAKTPRTPIESSSDLPAIDCAEITTQVITQATIISTSGVSSN